MCKENLHDMLDSLCLEKQVGVMSVQISKVRGGASSRPDCLFPHFRRGRVVRQGSVWGEQAEEGSFVSICVGGCRVGRFVMRGRKKGVLHFC
jgi:hypothetical protein